MKALQNHRVRLLWFGQAFSAMGDEIYRVAFVWLSVQVIGSNTGYLSSLQLLAAIAGSVFGIRLVDHLHSEEAMIRLDSYRAIIVLIPVILYFLHIPSFAVMAACAFVLSGFGALFEPVVMETIPKVATEPVLLKATNGLMSTTVRLARILGPMTVGLLSGIIPIIHFFTLDSLTFIFSAYSIKTVNIRKSPPKTVPAFTWRIFADTLQESFKLLYSRPVIFRSLIAKCFVAGSWWLAYGLGLALLSNEISPNNVTFFGTMITTYGFGNVFGVILFGNLQRREPEKMIYHGLIWLGVFFLMVPLVKNYYLLLLMLALAGVGGPWNDLPFADLVQAHFPTTAISKIYRLRNITDSLFMFLMMTISPFFFHVFSVRKVIAACGILMALGGVLGELARRRSV
jgi:DHA3 family macrolide efflux protein-like MFS transporter